MVICSFALSQNLVIHDKLINEHEQKPLLEYVKKL